MQISHMMSTHLAQLTQTLNIGLLKNSLSTQAAQATVMLEDFAQAQRTAQAPHPTLGRHLDLKV